ncbi:hypothetical protein MUK42_15937 [Musa troglodytarum]|uniref:Uncharacterized protein n=1 Tax=Musa troglodytarum TaxID=320322 RepID=A0A9E7GAF3_9LILI|nr:hypothetical protein MUK42_15937 [Musa troglodytarum]
MFPLFYDFVEPDYESPCYYCIRCTHVWFDVFDELLTNSARWYSREVDLSLYARVLLVYTSKK